MVESITKGKNSLHDPFQLCWAPDLIKYMIGNAIRDENLQRTSTAGKNWSKKIRLASSEAEFITFKLPLRSETWNRSKTRAEYLQTMVFSVALVPMLLCSSHIEPYGSEKGNWVLRFDFLDIDYPSIQFRYQIPLKLIISGQIWSMMTKISSNQWMSCALKQKIINRNFWKKLEGGDFDPGPKFQWSNCPFKTTWSSTTESLNHRDLYCQKLQITTKEIAL
jgi:hypothetical protein